MTSSSTSWIIEKETKMGTIRQRLFVKEFAHDQGQVSDVVWLFGTLTASRTPT